MLRLLALLLASLVVSASVGAQSAVIEGTVRDSDGVLLPGASVYLSGTTLGDAADAEGRYRIESVPPGAYRLVGSLVGYATEVVEIRLAAGARPRFALVLAPATLDLGTIRVEAERDPRWQRRLEQFTRALIGESDNAAETTILNPEVLDFRMRWGELRATARAPLVIENRALGYRLVYDLHEFRASATSIRYDGDERFEELTPASDEEAAWWEAARARAYRGSLRHLLRALLADALDENEFSLRLHRDDSFLRHLSKMGLPVSARRLMRIDDDGWGTLQASGRLEVTYRGEPEEAAYLESEWFNERRRRPDSVQRSTVEVDRGHARIDSQGTPEDPFALVTMGHIAFERLADLVPEEYLPPADS